MTCYTSNGGYCVIWRSCDSLNVWDKNYGFKIKFQGSTNWVIMPLSALLWDTTNLNECTIMIEPLDSSLSGMTDQVVLGAMFMQQYVNYWQYDLTTNTTTALM